MISLTAQMRALPALHHVFILVCACAVTYPTLELAFIHYGNLEVKRQWWVQLRLKYIKLVTLDFFQHMLYALLVYHCSAASVRIIQVIVDQSGWERHQLQLHSRSTSMLFSALTHKV